MSAAHRWWRGDGTVLSQLDLAEAVPMLRHELDDIARLLDLVEQWLRSDEDSRHLLTDWLIAASHPVNTRTTHQVIDELGSTSVTLHHILRTDCTWDWPPTRTPNTADTRPPTR